MQVSYTTTAVIARSPAEVFDYLSDLRNEIDWNPAARRIAKLTEGPLGVGTKLRAQWRNAPTTVVTITRFEPPVRWQTSSRSLGIDVVFTGMLSEADGGTRYVARLELHATGLARLVLPFAVRAMRRQDRSNMALIKRSLEARHGPPAAPSPVVHPQQFDTEEGAVP